MKTNMGPRVRTLRIAAIGIPIGTGVLEGTWAAAVFRRTGYPPFGINTDRRRAGS